MIYKKINLKIKYIITKLRDIWRYRNYKKSNNDFDKSNSFGNKSKLLRTKWGVKSDCNFNCLIIDTVIGNYVNIERNILIGARNHIHKNFTTHDFIYT